MARVRTAVVIGGGIAGPVVAVALRRAGIAATVYEAYAKNADGIGGELMLAPNGMAALAAIGIAEEVGAAGVPTPRMVMETGAGKRLGQFEDLPGLPTSRTFKRARLYRALVDAAVDAGVPIEYGRRLVGFEDGVDSVVAVFEDGTRVEADVLIGADGIWSTVRGLLDPGAPQPRFSGLVGLGGWARDAGLPSTAGAMHLAYGRKAFFGYRVGDDAEAGWFANVHSAEMLTAAQARAIPESEWLARLRELFADDELPALRLLDQVDPGELVNVGGLQDMPPVRTWSRGRVVLVGDAAHATTPSSGQGASLSIESAVELARCLRDLPVAEAFRAYEGLRRARVEKVIARTARINNDKAPGPVGRVVRDLVFPLVMRTFYQPERMMGWLHRYTIDWDAVVPAPQS
ncbi:FAD-dependent monooxygenase [Actinoplanes friuliensis]|uniref:Monooxygenase FAD-binding protein n=1 Tax=Actinoplanes friuliensis DSM 7358 TaxID=1246995 RepID=U5VSD6_9ACTN|nr:FAD-dependent monooxygenase [Actinoplanes friuliensis]AGZ39727.1 monooxygenase FAD-binding protein [Actinoplanes friuliensis DSM 7358]